MVQVEGTNKGRARPKITLVIKISKYDMSIKKIIKSMILDKIEIIHMINLD